MSCESSLNQLSVETRAKLRSAQLLTSLPQVVSELLQNSLDAGASQVDIGVDCEEWSCWVRDNGAGISKAGLTMIGKGSEEGRYSESYIKVFRHVAQPVNADTSKAYTPASLASVSTFGFRGEGLMLLPHVKLSLKLSIALSSMAELCCLEISSRTSQSRESWSVILKVRECACCVNTAQVVLQGGKSLYSGPSIRWRREIAGTVVCVRDAFFSVSQVILGVFSYDAHTGI
jgi:DNA mismatch repair protein MLH3